MVFIYSGRGRNFSFRGGPWFIVAVLIFLSLVLEADAYPLLILAATRFRRTQ